MCHLMITTLNVSIKGTFSSLVYVHHNEIKANVQQIDTSGTTLMFQLELGYVYKGAILSLYIIYMLSKPVTQWIKFNCNK